MTVLLGVWESVRREDASSEAIVLHAVRGVVYTGRVVATVPAGRSGAIDCTSQSSAGRLDIALAHSVCA